MSTTLLRKSLQDATVIKKGDYHYLVHPLTDGIPEVDPALLNEVCEEMILRIQKLGPIDKIVTIEAMGIPLATALSLKLNLPFVVIRKRKYLLEGEKEILQVTGYSKSMLYINGLTKGDQVVIIDDIISTGRTLKALLTELIKMKVNVGGVVTVLDKDDISKKLSAQMNIPIINLARINSKN